MQNALARLSDRERKVLELRFGLNERDELKIREASKEMDVSMVTISKLQRSGLRKLKDILFEMTDNL